MDNFIIDEGYKEFTINNDKNRVIRFSPSDFNILDRFNLARKNIAEIAQDLEQDAELKVDGEPLDELAQTAQLINQVNTKIRGQIDFIFDSPVSEVVFGNQSPVSLVKGVPFFERFLNAAEPFIEKELKQEKAASNKRVLKYTKGYKK